MQLDRLLSRIRAALQDYASEFEQRALAAEYAELCAKATHRLEQIVPLINNGQDYPALQVAESPPPVLDLVRQLSFAEAEQWRAFCRRHSLPVPQPFDERNLDLVNQLYGKKIGETHPFYRDYRQALRTHQEQQALRILQSIRRVNPDDANAHAEFSRLAHKIFEQKKIALTAALDAHDETRSLALIESIEEDGWPGREQDAIWPRAMQCRAEHQLKAARERCVVIAGELRGLQEAHQWEETLPLLAEWDSLHAQFSFSDPPAEAESAAAVRQWSSAHLATRHRHEQLEQLAKELTARLEELARENPVRLPAKALASRLEELLVQKTQLAGLMAAPGDSAAVPAELVARLDKHITLLRNQQRRRRQAGIASATLAAAAIIAVVCVVGWLHARQTTRADELARLQVLIQNHDAASLDEFLKDFDAKYSYLNDDATLAPLLEQARSYLKSTEAVQDTFNTELASLDKIANAPGATPTQISTQLKDLDSLDKVADKLAPDEAQQAKSELQTRRVKWDQQLTLAQEKNATRLADIAARADQALAAQSGLASAESAAETAKQARAILDEAGPNAGNTDDASPAEKAAAKQIADLSGKVDALATAARDAITARTQLAQAHSLDEYRAPVESLAANPLINDPSVAAAHALLAEKPDWTAAAQRILLPGDPETWAFLATLKDTNLQPAQDAQNEDIAYTRIVENNVLGNIYRANLVEYLDGAVVNKTPVFLAGSLDESKTAFGAGSQEILQHGVIINSNGTTTPSEESLKVFNGQKPRGKTFENAKLAPESTLIARLHQALDARTSEIREPLLRVLDDVRASADSSPILKAYLQQELTKIMRNRPRDWGLAFSPSAQADARELDKITGGSLLPADWLFSTDPHLADNLAAFFKNTADHKYYNEAADNLEKLRRLHSIPLHFAGYVDLNAQPQFPQPPPTADLWGLDVTGAWQVLFQSNAGQIARAPTTSTPARLTPLVFLAQ